MTHPQTAQSKVIVVLGMHRSGTSVITRALKAMGVSLGKDHLPPDRHNRKGYWEDAEIQALNTEMLHAIGSDWQHLTPITQEDIAALHGQGYHRHAAEMLSRKAAGTSLFGLKDPRITRLLPFWRGVFAECAVTVDYVLAVRNPLSVADSLNIRDGLPHEHSFLLWLTHVIAALEGGDGKILSIADFDQLMDDPAGYLSALSAALDIPVEDGEAAIFVNQFIDPDLQHTAYDSDALAGEVRCPALVKEIYAELQGISAKPAEIPVARLREKLHRWTAERDRLQPVLVGMDDMFRRNQRLEKAQAKSASPSVAEAFYAIGRAAFRKLPLSDRIRTAIRR